MSDIYYKQSPTSSDYLRLAGLTAGTGLGLYSLKTYAPYLQDKLVPVGQFISDNPYIVPATLGTAIVGSILLNKSRKDKIDREY